ncbi:MAG TPA: hypothetical protein PK876_08625 [Elusimicrobiota bacterium]|nr:hypothetical protein [Elusimicrobiota bacterium]
MIRRVAVLLAGAALTTLSQPLFSMEPDPTEVLSSTDTTSDEERLSTARALSVQTGVELKKYGELIRKGFGDHELMTLSLIYSGSGKTGWDRLVKEREKGKTLKQLAEDRGLDYSDIYRRVHIWKEQEDGSISSTAPPEKSAEPSPR